MRRALVAAFAIVALAWQGMPVGADVTEPPERGRIAIVCKLVTIQNIDPITGNADSHQHQFFGSKSVRLGESVADLQTAGTTCVARRDTASYWAPTLYVNGRMTPASDLGVYYNNGEKPVADLHNLPPGLKLIAGDAHATTRQSIDVVNWNCGEGTTPANAARRDYIPACPRSAQALKLHVRYPDCLAVDDLGEPLIDSDDHQSHAAYSQVGVCPTDHPYAIPRLIQSLRFKPKAFLNKRFPNPKGVGGPDDVWLSSDTESGPPAPDQAGITAHGDFYNGWNYSNSGKHRGLDDLFTNCIVALVLCPTIK